MTCSVAGIATESLQLRCQNFQKKLVGSRENPRKRPREEALHESSVGCTPDVSESKKYDEKETTLMDMVSIIKYCLVYPKISNIHNVFEAVNFDAEKGGVNTGMCK